MQTGEQKRRIVKTRIGTQEESKSTFLCRVVAEEISVTDVSPKSFDAFVPGLILD
jgi:hypothetical protein